LKSLPFFFSEIEALPYNVMRVIYFEKFVGYGRLWLIHG